MATSRMINTRVHVSLLVFITVYFSHPVDSNPASYQVSCPEICQCKTIENHRKIIADCSNRGLQDVPPGLDPSTIHLDLSGNQIRELRPEAFQGLANLKNLLLHDNWISSIRENAFKGLPNLQMLDLRRNNLSRLRANSLARLQGSPECSDTNLCSVNLQENPLHKVDSYALSWCNRMSFILGNSSTDLTIEAYALYGAENIPSILIHGLPTLTLEPRVFTNTDSVRKLEIRNTQVNTLQKFTFEGLKNVDQILFHNCHFSGIEEFAFSGILYTSNEASYRVRSGTDHDALLNGGGVLNISGSSIPFLPGDGFRDTNLQTIVFNGNEIDSIKSYAFRGIHRLSLLEMSSNQIDSIQKDAFGALKNVPHVKFHQNRIGSIEGHAFRDSQSIDQLTFHLSPNTNFTLDSYSFSGLRDVGILDIKGAPGSTFQMNKDAFHDLGGVHTLRISNVSLPIVKQHTFRGLSKIQTLLLENCNISKIEADAFGDARTNGAIAMVKLSSGNNLACNCETNILLRDFETRFSKFSVSCNTEKAEVKVLTVDTLNWPSCGSRSGSQVLRYSNLLLFALSCGVILIRCLNL